MNEHLKHDIKTSFFLKSTYQRKKLKIDSDRS